MKRALLLLLLVAGGCTKARTETVVVVTTDGVRIPDDVDNIQLVVADTNDAANPLFMKNFRLCGGNVSADCLGLPLDFTLIPGAQHPSDSTRVRLTAQRGSMPLIDDAAVFTFAPGQSLRLDFVLYANCLGNVDCAARDQACGPDDKCQPVMPTHIQGEPDLATPPPRDFAVPVDMALGPDLSVGDLALGADMRVGPDLKLAPDMAPGPDMANCVPFCDANHQCGPDPTGCNTVDPNYCGTCTVGTQYCYQMAGLAQCMSCGQSQGEICCPPSGTCSGANLYCNGGTCAQCGSMAGQICCPGMTCNSGLHCMTGMCVPDSDGGASGWTRLTFAPGTLSGVWSNGSLAVAVGATSVGGGPRIFRKVGASPWTSDADPDTHDLYGVWGAAAGQVAVGDNATILNYNGSWTRVADGTTGIPTTIRQNGVFAGPVDYWVAGGNVATPGSDPFDYEKDGTSASLVSGTSGYARTSVWGDGSMFYIMTSTDGHSFVSTNGGASFSTVSAAAPKGITLRKAWGTDAMHVWLVGDQGYVYRYNGTATLALDSQLAVSLKGVSGSSTTDVWAVGDSGYVFHYNGTGWMPVTDPTILASDSYKDVFVVSPSDVYIVGTSGAQQLILHGP